MPAKRDANPWQDSRRPTTNVKLAKPSLLVTDQSRDLYTKLLGLLDLNTICMRLCRAVVDHLAGGVEFPGFSTIGGHG